MRAAHTAVGRRQRNQESVVAVRVMEGGDGKSNIIALVRPPSRAGEYIVLCRMSSPPRVRQRVEVSRTT